LEVKASELLTVGAKATLVATLGVIVPFFAGWGIMSAWVCHKSRPFLSRFHVATSVGITASVLSAKGLPMKSPVRLFWPPRSLTTAWLDRSCGGQQRRTRPRKFLEIALTAGLAIAFTVVMGLWGTKAANRLMPHFDSRVKATMPSFTSPGFSFGMGCSPNTPVLPLS